MPKSKSDSITIALAWLVPDFVVVKEGRRDLGERPTIKETVKAVSLIWINKGDSVDLEKAQKYIDKNTVEYDRIAMFVYPSTEKDVLEKAKRDLLKSIQKRRNSRD